MKTQLFLGIEQRGFDNGSDCGKSKRIPLDLVVLINRLSFEKLMERNFSAAIREQIGNSKSSS
jgi:hypothetical protein